MFGLWTLKHIYIKTLLVCNGVDDSGSQVDAYHAGFGEGTQRDVKGAYIFLFKQFLKPHFVRSH